MATRASSGVLLNPGLTAMLAHWEAHILGRDRALLSDDYSGRLMRFSVCSTRAGDLKAQH